jgi:hypothetical protein
MFGQLLDDAIAEKELEELGFGNVGSEFDVIEATLAKLVDNQGLVVFKDNEVHRLTPGRTTFADGGRALFVEQGNALLDASGLELIGEGEQLAKPADKLSARLAAAAVVIGHVAKGREMFGGWGDILRSALSAKRQDGAFVKFTTSATARRFAALTPQGIERARQEWLTVEAGLEQTRQESLGLAKLQAQRTETLVHGRALAE